jgi:hypothetical protein
MKINLFFLRWIFLSILFFQVTDLYSQTYHHFIDSCKHWRTIFQSYDDYQINHFYITNFDTVINGIKYFKFFYRLDGSDGNFYIGSIREDTIERRVYFIQNSDLTERLLYDFSLMEGDTIPQDSYFLHVYPSTDTCKVDGIDSVQINGHYLKRWIIISAIWGDLITYIYEGIGSILGPFTEWYQFEWSEYLDCVSICDSTIFPSNAYICHGHDPISINELKKTDKVIIKPNPVTDISELTLISNNDNIIQLKIFNEFGIQEKDQIINKVNTVKLEKCNFTYGVYLYQVITLNKIIYYGKLIIL